MAGASGWLPSAHLAGSSSLALWGADSSFSQCLPSQHSTIFLYNVLRRHLLSILGIRGDWNLTPFLKGFVIRWMHYIYSFSERLLKPCQRRQQSSGPARDSDQVPRARRNPLGFSSPCSRFKGERLVILARDSSTDRAGFSLVVDVSLETSLCAPHLHGLGSGVLCKHSSAQARKEPRPPLH